MKKNINGIRIENILKLILSAVKKEKKIKFL